MADEAGLPESGADPISVTLALSGASRDKADAFLEEQRHHLKSQFALLLWEKRLGVLLRLATAFAGIAIAAGIALTIWDASRSSGLLIEPFSVPPDLVQNGMTGEAVAARVLDHIAAMEAKTVSARAPRSYANSWSEQDLKIDIPETGLSLSQIDNFLRAKLGHDIHVTGEVVRTEAGLSLSVRASGAGAASVTGGEKDLDSLIQDLSEAVYKLTQPYRYGVYLNSNGRAADSIAIFRSVAESGAGEEPGWGYNGWYISVQDTAPTSFDQDLLNRGVALAPDNPILQSNRAALEAGKGRDEEALAGFRKSLAAIRGSGKGMINPAVAPMQAVAIQATVDFLQGDFHASQQGRTQVIQSYTALGGGTVTWLLALAQASDHDLAGARDTLAHPVGVLLRSPGFNARSAAIARMKLDGEAANWVGVVADAETLEPLLPQNPGVRSLFPTSIAPELAVAQARLGRIRAAEAAIAATPADCEPCLVARGQIAEIEGQHARADWWFARAVAAAPSIPLAAFEWGRALLARGQADAGIEKFALSNRIGPHFADALEYWGEALMAKNQSHLALAKFAAANKYAPNWGRLELKWGEALTYAGKKDEAAKHFARAAALDLTPSEKTELAGMNHG